MTARYIAIDWGSTNLRAWLYQGEECLESRQSEAGVTRLNGRSPADDLFAQRDHNAIGLIESHGESLCSMCTALLYRRC